MRPLGSRLERRVGGVPVSIESADAPLDAVVFDDLFPALSLLAAVGVDCISIFSDHGAYWGAVVVCDGYWHTLTTRDAALRPGMLTLLQQTHGLKDALDALAQRLTP